MNPTDGKAPQNQQEQREMWDALTRRRQEMIDAEKAKRQEKIDEADEVQKRQEAEFLAEVAAGRKRTDEREVWRREQHEKRRALEELKKKEEAEQKRLADIAQKKKEQFEKEMEQMAELHKKAIEKRVHERVLGARSEEEKQKRQATHMEDMTIAHTDENAARKIEHFEREAKRKKDALTLQADRKRNEAEEQFKKRKHEAEVASREQMHKAKDETEKRDIRLTENQAVSRAEAERKRITSGLEEVLQQQLFDIDTETKRLIDEVKRDEQQHDNRVHMEAERKRREAAARRENTEEWVLRRLPKVEKDSKEV